MRPDAVSVPRWHKMRAPRIITALLIMVLGSAILPQAQAARLDQPSADASPVVLQELNIPAVFTRGFPFAITSTWAAANVPADSQWDVVYQFRNDTTGARIEFIAQADLADALLTDAPALTDEFWLPDTIAVGTYAVSVLVRDPTGSRSQSVVATAAVQSVQVRAWAPTATTYLPLANAAFGEGQPRSAVPTTMPVFLTPERITAMRTAIQQQRNPNYDAYRDLLGECRSALSAGEHAPRTIYVPGFYVNRAGHSKAKEAIRTDANNVYALGVCYRLSDDERYANAAATIIKAWATNVKEINTADDTTLVLSYHFPAMIFGADLIRLSSAYQAIDKAFTNFLQQKMVAATSIDRISRVGCGYGSGQATNNWSNWGTVLTITIGAYTNDIALFTKAVEQWKANIAFQVDKDGNLPMEGTRNNCTGNAGVGYTNFAMQAFSLTAEIANNNGIDLFHYTVNGDNPYLRSWTRTAHVMHYPSTFPFATWKDADYGTFRYNIAWFELANSYFPNDDAAWVLTQFRPVVSREVFRYGTVTHGVIPAVIVRPAAPASGSIIREYWLNQNLAIDDLQGTLPLPSGSNLLTRFEGPTHGNTNYASRIRGYVIPPTTGAYTFWIASDDFSRLYLSTDAIPANKREIARLDAWTGPREWNKYRSQQSIAVPLAAGQRYYIEATHQQWSAGENLAVGWATPGQRTEQPNEIIPGSALDPYQP